MTAPLTLTLNAIRAKAPCAAGWAKLLTHLGKTEPDDAPLLLETVLDANGILDAIWCLRVLSPEHERTVRLFAVWCARQVQPLMRDERSLHALDVAEAYANGKAPPKELKAAATAAYAAAYAAATAAYAAAYAAAHAAAAAADATHAAHAAAAAAAYAAHAAAAAAAYAAYAAPEMRARQADKFREICRAGFIGSTQKDPS